MGDFTIVGKFSLRILDAAWLRKNLAEVLYLRFTSQCKLAAAAKQ